MIQASELKKTTNLDIYPASVTEAAGATYFLARRGTEKLVGCLGKGAVKGNKVASLAGQDVIIGPMHHTNAVAVRAALPWTAPRWMWRGAGGAPSPMAL